MKPKFAYLHLGACSGCEISMLDTFERFLDILGMVDVEYMILLKDVQEVPKVDVLFVDGAACLQSEESVQELLEARKNAGLLVAWGGCSSTACITNFSRGGQMAQPQHESYPPINRLVKVDAFVPGCPPGPELAYNLVKAVVDGDVDYLKYLTAENGGGFACGCDLMKEIIDNGLCIGCGACAMSCPTRAISMQLGRPDIITERCVKCGACFAQCPRSFLPLPGMNKMMEE